MSLQIYNTLSKKKEVFTPLEEGKVGMYCCGITAYDECHIGHARSAIVFDVIYRYLRYRGFNVTYVKNFTDVDDKIIAKANAEGKDIAEIAERYIKEHNEDMDALGLIRPTVTPRATENIKGMIRMIARLIEAGLAYCVNGDVFYSVDKFNGYGKLSGRTLNDMMAGARIEVDEKKKNPFDFVLWKASKKGEPWWDSPWGRGRPGWHIECSVMSQRYLGETFDIHGGGEDLIFPHHENEIAQAEGATDKPFARYWIHNGFIKISSEKMSKSLGNFYTVKDVLKKYHPEVVRLFILQSHYRSVIDFSDEALRFARGGMERFYSTLKNIEEMKSRNGSFDGLSEKNLSGINEKYLKRIDFLPERFVKAMDDDFNTARAIGYIFDTIRLVNAYISDKEFIPDAESMFVLDSAKRYIREVGKVLGLFLDDPVSYFEQDRRREAGKRDLDRDTIEGLIHARNVARQEKQWEKADSIREELRKKGVVLRDSSQGTIWSVE
ncbi:MAG: cysteine--tRNA ligase [Syntrophales bacterium]|jgi:cysteinyl-tRNA synthetase|nr:cysteine--tRNA ligase [Syntrophales bacterium]MDY0043146.1 cysteine--tRNA ligase [Syntrophales bacterium]